jgi:LysM repeat protein
MMMKKRLFLLLTLLCFAAAPAPAQEYVPVPVTVTREKVRQNGKLYYSHVVLERQTLYSISKAYQVSVEEIYAANPTLRQTGLQKNAILLIPVKDGVNPQTAEEGTTAAGNEPAPSGNEVAAGTEKQQAATPADLPDGTYQEYTVRWFDTLYGISRRFGVSVEEIMAANGLTSTSLRTGQVLRIPEKAAEPQETPETAGGEDGKKGPLDTVKDIIQDIKEEIDEKIEEYTFQPKPNVEAALLLPFNASGNPSDMYMDFYAGVLMGIRDLESAGTSVKLHVHDVATGVIPSQEQLAVNDFVLGPVSSKDLETVLQRSGGLVPVISPLEQKAADLLGSYVNLVQAPSSARAQYTDLAEWVVSEKAWEDRLVVLTEKDMDNAAGQALIEAMQLRGGSYSTFTYSLREGTSVPTRIQEYLAKNRTNRILVASDRQPFLNDVIRNVGILLGQGYDIVLYSPSKIRTYDIDSSHFHEAQLHLSSAYFVDYDDPRVRQFILSFRALYNTEPSQFAFQGYDTITHFAQLVSRYGTHWMRMLENGTEKGLHTDFRFRDRQNEASRRVIYKKDFTTGRAR